MPEASFAVPFFLIITKSPGGSNGGGIGNLKTKTGKLLKKVES
jgi:hypothetical protein